MEKPTMKLLNDKQKDEVRDWLKIYKYVYMCNVCGRIYGSEFHQRSVICPICEGALLNKKNAVKKC